MFKLVKVIIS